MNVFKNNQLDLSRVVMGAHGNGAEYERMPLLFNVFFVIEPGKIESLEGLISYQAGDAIITGVNHEQWPVSKEKFPCLYLPLPGQYYGNNGQYLRRTTKVWASQIEHPFFIQRPGDCKINGHAFDWLIQDSNMDNRIVADGIFQKTYRICK